MAERDLLVRIIGDDRDLQRALTNTQRSVDNLDRRTSNFGKNIGRAFAAAASGVGVAEAFRVIGDSVTKASDLNEQISRTEVVLGESSQAMIEWSETTATAMGISQRAALAAAGTFAGLFQTVGVNRNQAAELSRSLVQLAADLASLQNSSPEEALVALRSGLAGEIEPLRRFNIFLTEARVAQQALTETGKDNVRQLTQQEKVLARYNLILKDSTLAQGNFALTSDELANQQRILRAQLDDLSTQLGQVLIPTLTGMVGAFNDAIAAGEDLVDVWNTLAGLPGVEIPVKFVSEVAGGRGGDILRHIVLGSVSPLALGITIGKEIADGISQGVAATVGDGAQPGVGGAQRAASRAARAEQEAQERIRADNVRTGNEIISGIVRRGAAEKSYTQLLAESARRAEHLKDLIRADPENAKLQQRLTAEIATQNSLRQQQVALNRQNAAASQANAAAAKAETAAIAEARREREKAAAEERRRATQRRQFRALGLTAEGEQRAPGIDALQQRAASLEKALQGTILDSPKTKAKFDQIASVLEEGPKKVGRTMRLAILGMINDIASALDEGDRKLEGGGGSGEITRGGIRSTQKLIKDLGLTAEQAAAIRRRNLGVGHTAGQTAFGFALAQGPVSDAFLRGGAGGDGLGITNEIRVFIGGQEVQNVITREQQKKGRRTAASRRGRAGGRIAGV